MSRRKGANNQSKHALELAGGFDKHPAHKHHFNAPPTDKPMSGELSLFGNDLFGNAIKPKQGALAERFIVPPFSVLNAREGGWQSRKRAWLSLGIQSELGRGGDAGFGAAVPGEGGASAIYRKGPGFKYENAEEYKEGHAIPGGGTGKNIAYMFKDKDGYKSLKDRESGKGLCFNGASGWQAEKKTNNMAFNGAVTDNPDMQAAADLLNQASGTSIFDPVLCELMYRWFSPPNGLVLDAFAGGSVRGIVAAKLGRKYYGIDLSAAQLAANATQAQAICPENPPQWVCGDSRDLLPQAPFADFLFTYPPYGNLEVYSDNPRDLSAMEYFPFMQAYRDIIGKACGRLLPNRFAAIVVGDYRDDDGCYRNFVSETIKAFLDAGMKLYNEAVLITAVGSLPVRVGIQFTSSRKLGKTHQNALVFVKGDPQGAAAICESAVLE